MPTALVTGATGMVGRHVAERFLRDGWGVRALVRDASRARVLAERGISLHTGDTLDTTSFDMAAHGCEVIVHSAAAITPKGGWEAFRRPNIDGTANAIHAANAAGARLVHVSSVAVYGNTSRFRADGQRTSEDTPLGPIRDTSLYARSKRESEEMVMAAHAAGKIWATAVRPDVIYGRYDRQFVPRMARLLRFGVMPVVAGGRTVLPIVHAENVADGIVRAALTDSAGGRAYNLANDFDVTVARFFRLGAAGLGKTLRTPSVPMGMARLGLGVFRRVGSVILGSQFNVATSASLDFLTRDNPFSSDRARRELGWRPPVDPELGVPDAFRWALEHPQ